MIDAELRLCRPYPEPEPEAVERHRAQLRQAMDKRARLSFGPAAPSRWPGMIMAGAALLVVVAVGLVALVYRGDNQSGRITSAGAGEVVEGDLEGSAGDTVTTTTQAQVETTATEPAREGPARTPLVTTAVQDSVPAWLYPTDVGGDDSLETAVQFAQSVLSWTGVSAEPLRGDEVGTWRAVQINSVEPQAQLELTLQRDSFANGWVITSMGGRFAADFDDEALYLRLDVPPNTEPVEIVLGAREGQSVEYTVAGDEMKVTRVGGGVPELVFAFVIYRNADGFASSAQGALIQPGGVNGGRLGLALEAGTDSVPQDGSLVIESRDVVEAPTEAVECQGAPPDERPPNLGTTIDGGQAFDSPQLALQDFLARPEADTFFKSGYIEMIGTDDAITYGAPFDSTAREFVTLIRTELTEAGWTVTSWTASGC